MKLVNVFDSLGRDMSIKLCYLLYINYNMRIPIFIGTLSANKIYVFTEDGHMSGANDYLATIENDEIQVEVNIDKKISKKMQYEAIYPKQFLVSETNNLEPVSFTFSRKQIWDSEINRRYEIWRGDNFNKPVKMQEQIKETANGLVYLLSFIVIAAIFVFVASFFSSSDDCYDNDRFGVNQVCGDEVYQK
ncbi:hypothetical protein HQN88_30825 [Paenibacillus qinlingensis]|nr:hypothetical protein [Paenibacillus qinlingensis]